MVLRKTQYGGIMDFEKLDTFVSVANTGSFTKTAELKLMSPASIMRHIDSIEKEIGTRLFIRNPSGCKLTEAGLQFLSFTKKTLDDYQTIKNKLNKKHPTIKKEIIICNGGGSYTFDQVEYVFSQFMTSYPHISLRYKNGEWNHWSKMLIHNEADAAFVPDYVYHSVNDGSLLFTPVYKSKYLAIMKFSHPLAKKGSISLNDLKDYSIIIPNSIYPKLTEELEKLNIQINSSNDNLDSTMIFNLCAKGNIYILNDVIKNQFHSVKKIPIEFEPITDGWMTRKERTEELNTFISFSKEKLSNNK